MCGMSLSCPPSVLRCLFSAFSVGLLRGTVRCVFSERGAGVDFGSFDILSDEHVRAGLKVYSNWPTFPQVS